MTSRSNHIIDEIAALGPHFALEVNTAGADDTWQPISTLTDGSPTLLARYRQVQDALSAMSGAPVDLRVAASVGHLGLIARLICPTFGAALLGYRLDLTPATWQPVVGGILPLAVPPSALTPASGPVQIITTTITGLLDATTHLSVSPTVSVSPKVLWGNVFSAINGAAETVCAIRPDLADRARALAGEPLTGPHLREAFTGTPGVDGRRRSCCLIYRMAPAGSESYCSDCILSAG